MLAAAPAARPRYGGTLRVETAVSIRALDPREWPADPIDADAQAALLPLVFETLVGLDAGGALVPRLAVSWTHHPDATHWSVALRPGVKLHDGTTLAAAQVAGALAESEPDWRVNAAGETIVIDLPQPGPDLPWQLADPRHAIGVRTKGDVLVGTGPFRVERWEAGRHARLVAHEEHWAGRPFVDALEIQMGRTPRDLALALELARADVAPVTPQDARRLASRGIRIAASRPHQLVAIVFDPPRPGAAHDTVRAALALAVDRAAIGSVLLQGYAQPATSLLPPWLTGYAAAFAPSPDRARAQTLLLPLAADARRLTLDYDSNDVLAPILADRIAADAHAIGLVVDVGRARTGSRADAHLLRLPLAPAPPERALAALAFALGLDAPPSLPAGASPGGSAALGAVWKAEQDAIDARVVLPLVHLPSLYGVGPRVESAARGMVLLRGGFDLANAYLGSGSR